MITFIALSLVIFLFSITSTPTTSAKRATAKAWLVSPRAMWIWDTTAPSEDVVSWAKTHNINRVYVAVDWNAPEGSILAHYQELRTATRQANITMYALGGDPSWGIAGGEEYAALWTERMVESGLFDGVQLDVEPYTAPGQWTPEQQPTTVAAYLQAMTNARSAAGSFPLEIVVPFWYDTIPTTYEQRTLLQEVISRSDSIAVMAYRDTAPHVLSIITEELSAAATEHKKVYIGLETNDTGIDYVDFSGENTRNLEAVARTVAMQLANDPAFGGIAIHDYTAWKKLKY